MKIRSLLLCVLVLFSCYSLLSKPQAKEQPSFSIILTLLPAELLHASAAAKIAYFTRPKPFYSGVFVSYYGYMETFDTNDRIVFPRKTAKDEITCIVTPEIVPVVFEGNVVDRLMFTSLKTTALYKLTRLKDAKSNFYFWQVKKGTPPKNRVIPLDAITFCAHPQDIIIPEGNVSTFEGIYLTSGGKTLELPIFFWQPQNDGLPHLSPINFLQHFARLEKWYKYQKDRYALISF